MFGWLRELLELRSEYRKRCDTCDVLRVQLERANYEKEQLLKEILAPKTISEPVINETDLKPISPKTHIPWKVRQEALEATDRQKAKLLKDKAKELELVRKTDVTDLERELDIASEQREARKA